MKRWQSAERWSRGKQVLGIILSMLLLCSSLTLPYVSASEPDENSVFATENSEETQEMTGTDSEDYVIVEPTGGTDSSESDPTAYVEPTSDPEISVEPTSDPVNPEITVEPVNSDDPTITEEPMDPSEPDAQNNGVNQENPVEPTISDTPENLDEEDLIEDEEQPEVGAITGNNKVAVGSSITLTGSGANYQYHDWQSGNTRVATVSGNTATATVTGVAPGTATITHRYRYSRRSSWISETVDVRVLNKSTFQYNLTNASVMIFHYTADGASGWELVGSYDSSGSITIDYDSSKANYWVVMARVPENYLLTGIGANGNDDIYPITDSSYGNINGYPSIHALAGQYGAGYNAIFGYSRGAGGTLDLAKFELVGQQPPISVSAAPDKVENLSPGTQINLTLTVEPGKVYGKDVIVNYVQLSNLTIGGKPVSINGQTTVTLTKNSQGLYSVQVPYTLTEADCGNPTLKIAVDGAVEYSFRLVGKDGTFPTTSTITSSAETSVKIADYRTAAYSYVWDEGVDHSQTSFPIPPTDTSRYYYGRANTVPVDGGHLVPNGTEVVDNANHGVWVFDGWYRNNEGEIVDSVNLAANDEQGLHFVGRWHFEKNTMSVNIQKNVTGNMGDRTKEFSFTVTDSDGKEIKTFSLMHGQTQTLSDLPVGSTISITESENKGYTVSLQYGNDMIQASDGSYSITLEEDKTDIIVTNHKNAIPDTAVFLDSKPYQLLLVVLVFAALIFINFRRRSTYND